MSKMSSCQSWSISPGSSCHEWQRKIYGRKTSTPMGHLLAERHSNMKLLGCLTPVKNLTPSSADGVQSVRDRRLGACERTPFAPSLPSKELTEHHQQRISEEDAFSCRVIRRDCKHFCDHPNSGTTRKELLTPLAGRPPKQDLRFPITLLAALDQVVLQPHWTCLLSDLLLVGPFPMLETLRFPDSLWTPPSDVRSRQTSHVPRGLTWISVSRSAWWWLMRSLSR